MIESLINPSFLLFLGVLMMTVSFLVIYFEGKMREQNHKISSMLSLVYTLAEDLTTLTAKVQNVTCDGNESLDNIHLNNSLEEPTMKINITQDNLIYVSDNDVNEDEEYEDSEEDEDSEEELDDDHEVEEDLDSEEQEVSEEYHEYVTKNNDIKILKIDLNTINDQDINIEFVENTNDELDIKLFKKTEDLNDLNENLKNEETEDKETDFKLNPNNLEENSNDTLDFKKLSIQKLRSVVTEKGLTNEANKLKKNELLKLLGLE